MVEVFEVGRILRMNLAGLQIAELVRLWSMLLAVVGFFMPWGSYEGLVMRGYEHMLTMAVGGFLVVSAFLVGVECIWGRDGNRQLRLLGPSLTFVGGVVVFGLCVAFSRLWPVWGADLLSERYVLPVTVLGLEVLGYGFWMTLVGSFVLIVSSGWVLTDRLVENRNAGAGPGN